MTVDRGGLEFAYVTTADLRGAESFLSKLEEIRRRFGDLQATINSGISLSGPAKDLADLNKQLSDNLKRLGNTANQEAIRQFNLAKEEIRENGKTQREQIRATSAAQVAAIKEGSRARNREEEASRKEEIRSDRKRAENVIKADKARRDAASKQFDKYTKEELAKQKEIYDLQVESDRRRATDLVKENKDRIDRIGKQFDRLTKEELDFQRRSKAAEEKAQKEKETQEIRSDRKRAENVIKADKARRDAASKQFDKYTKEELAKQKEIYNQQVQSDRSRVADLVKEDADRLKRIGKQFDRLTKEELDFQRRSKAAEEEAQREKERIENVSNARQRRLNQKRIEDAAAAELQSRKNLEQQWLDIRQDIDDKIEESAAKRAKAEKEAAKQAAREQERSARAARLEAEAREREELRRRVEAAQKAGVQDVQTRLGPGTEKAAQTGRAGSLQRVQAITQRIRDLELERNQIQARSLLLKGEEAIFARAQVAAIGNSIGALRAKLQVEKAALVVAQRTREAYLKQAQAIVGTGKFAEGVSGTLLRIAVAVAFFETIRRSVGAVKTILTSGIEFRQEIERAQAAISGIIAQTTKLRNPIGDVLDASQAFAAAQAEARRQSALLQKDALRTTATFEELLDAFQVSFAFGVQAGFNPNQIREFSVQISQAASLFGLQQNQLAEEIRSILQGTIRARDTRIATALGITNEQIRNARESGELFEFLQSKFDALSIATQSLAQKLGGLFERLRDAARQGSGLAAVPLFEALENAARRLLDRLVTDSGEIENGFVSAIAPLFKEAGKAVDILAERIESFSFDDLRKEVERFAPVLRQLVTALFDFIVGVVKALPVIGSFVSSIVSLIEVFLGFDTASKAIILFAAALTSLKVANALTFGLIGRLLATFLQQIGGIKVVGAAIARFFRAFTLALIINFKTLVVSLAAILSNPVALTAALAALTAVLLKQLAEVLVGFDLSWKDFGRLLVLQAKVWFAELVLAADRAAVAIVNGPLDLINKELQSIAEKAGIFSGLIGVRVASVDKQNVEDVKNARAELEAFLSLRRQFQEGSDRKAGSADFIPTRSFEAYRSRVQDLLQDLENRTSETAAQVRESFAIFTAPTRGIDIRVAEDVSSFLQSQIQSERRLLEIEKDRERVANGVSEAIKKQNQAATEFNTRGVPTGQIANAAGELFSAGTSLEDISKALSDSFRDSPIRQEIGAYVELVVAALEAQQTLIGLERDRLDVNQALSRLFREEASAAVFKRATELAKNQVSAELDLEEARTRLAGSIALYSQSQRRASQDLAQAQQSLLEQRLAASRADAEAGQQIRDLEQLFAGGQLSLKQLIESSDGSALAQAQIAALTQAVSVIGDQKNRLSEIREINQENNALIEQGLELERLRASILAGNGTAYEAAKLGLQQFVEGLPTINESIANSVSNIGQASVNATAGALRAILSDDVAGGLQEVAFSFADTLLNILSQTLAEQLFASIFQVTTPLASATASAAAVLAAGGQAAGAAIFSGALGASSLLTGLSVAGVAGSIPIAGATGGLVAFGKGGYGRRIRPEGPRLARPMPGVDKRDRFMALLRAGEFVMRPEAVMRYGASFMQSINDGQIHPANIEAILGPLGGSRATTLPTSVPSFADGGGFGVAAKMARAGAQGGSRGSSNGQGPSLTYISPRALKEALRGRDRIFTTLAQQYRLTPN